MGGTTMTALAATGEEAAGADEHEVVCVCGCNCQGNCSMVATVREGKMVNIRSNEDLPYPSYERSCMRGFSHANRMYDFNRVLSPHEAEDLELGGAPCREPRQRRVGASAWDEAIGLVPRR